MPAQHQPHMKEREPNGKTEMGQREVLSEGEGTKTPSKESQSGPQNPRKKKIRKKKKKKASQDNGKHPSQSKKQPIFEKSPLELLHPQSDDGMPQDAAAAKVIPGQASGNPLFASTSAFSFLTQGDSKVSNESLRWDGILDDPIAEAERLQNYRLNRRKRYGEYMQQNLPPEPSFTLRNLSQLCKVAQMSQEDKLPKSKSSASTSSGQEKPK